MASGREYTGTQRKIINRYYENHDTIIATRLGEIVTDMALAEGNAKKLDRLWTRAQQALAKTSISPETVSGVLKDRDPAKLAKLISRLA